MNGKYQDAKFKLGQEVQCRLTNYKGRIEHIVFYPHQGPRYGIQAPIKKEGGEMPKGYLIDETTLELTDKKSILDTPSIPEQRFEFAQPVVDPISGHKGKVVARAIYINGCARVNVQAHKKDHSRDGDIDTNGEWFPEQQVEPIGKVVKPKEDQPRIRTGGPSAFDSWR